MNLVGRIGRTGGALPRAVAPPLSPVSWRPALGTLALGLFAWAALFYTEILAAVRIWNSSTAYNHCWLIAPIAAWLFWQRRARLAYLAPDPAPLFSLLALPGSLVWFAAERLGVMEGRQLAAFGLAQVLVLAVLGWRFSLAFAGPLAYLIFLVPFGGFAVGPLQHITARLIDWGLDIVGVTHFVDGLMIETPAGFFHVAEACAGLRFIIAALAFGALYALVIFRSFWRRALVMALALIVPIIANGIRGGGIVVLAEHLGSAEAAAADHIIYGWGFFSAVILLLVLAGLPFREDAAPPAVPSHPAPRRPGQARPARLAAALVPTVALTAVGPALAASLASRSGGPAELPARLAAPAGCAAAADGLGLDCGGILVSARQLVFSPRANWNEVSSARFRLGQWGSDTDLTFTVPIGPAGGAWAARQSDDDPDAVIGAAATASWLNGRPVGDGLGSRIAQAKNSLVGGGGQPVLVAVQTRREPGAVSYARERAVLEAVLGAQAEGLAAEAARRSRGQ